MKKVAEFQILFEGLHDPLVFTVRGEYKKIKKSIVERYKLIDNVTVDINEIAYPPGIREFDFSEQELELIEKTAENYLLDRHD